MICLLALPPSPSSWPPQKRGWAAGCRPRPAAKRGLHLSRPQRSAGMPVRRHLQGARAGLARRADQTRFEGGQTSNAAAPDGRRVHPSSAQAPLCPSQRHATAGRRTSARIAIAIRSSQAQRRSRWRSCRHPPRAMASASRARRRTRPRSESEGPSHSPRTRSSPNRKRPISR